ncbi:MAG: DUF1800 domain-containing protein [Planctomycetes bacterium]|nr:DUF1800 domain-containing protein [Planctomycetota bacterium]
MQAARGFTGFNRLRRDGLTYGEVVYDKERHDANDKTIFGVTGKFGYDSVSPFHEDGETLASDARDTGGGIVALTLAQRPVEASRFVCRKLARFLLYDEPHDVVVDEMASDLRAANWNLKPVLERVLKSKAFFSLAARKAQIKSPVEYSVQILRSTGIPLRETLLRVTTESMGQALLDPPDVNGWPGGSSWLGSQASLARIDFLRIVIAGLNDVPTQVDPLLPPVGQRTPAEIVDHLADLLDVQLPADARTSYIAYVTQQKVGDSIVPFPFDPLNPEHRRMKTRGLLYMIGQHHDGQRQ